MAEKSGHRWKTRILHCVEPFVCFVSMILQIIGFSTNAWVVQQTKLDGRLTKFGIWSATICYELDCNTKTHMDEHRELMAKGFSARGIQYAFLVGHEVNTTLALVCVTLCFILSLLYIICKRGRRQIQITMVITSLLSGVLLLTVVGYWGAELRAAMRVSKNKLQYTYYFPWSLLVSGFGAIIIILNGIVLSVFACCRNPIRNVYETVTTKENLPDTVPHQCADDYEPPDYNDVQKDQDSVSDQSMV